MGSRPKIWPMRQYSRIITKITCEGREEIYRGGVGAMQCKYSTILLQRSVDTTFMYTYERSEA